jgi:hypothetical protein
MRNISLYADSAFPGSPGAGRSDESGGYAWGPESRLRAQRVMLSSQHIQRTELEAVVHGIASGLLELSENATGRVRNAIQEFKNSVI